MAKMNGCNSDMPMGTIGDKSTRMNPGKVTRNNLSKGGVNQQAGGSDTFAGKPALGKGKTGQGKYQHDKR